MTIENSLEKLRVPAPRLLTANVDLATGLADGYRMFDSPVGEVAVTFNPKGVSTVRLANETFESDFTVRYGRRLLAASPPKGWDALIGRAIEMGRPGTLPLDLAGVSPFRRQIMTLATTIPRGQVRPYGWLAQEAGKAGAARAVGAAMSHNPVPLIVPCHRVVRADGTIGAYSLGGEHNKWVLLTTEGADPAKLQQQAENGVRYVGSETTRILCFPSCVEAKRIAPTRVVGFHSSSEARSVGYSSCPKCRPS